VTVAQGEKDVPGGEEDVQGEGSKGEDEMGPLDVRVAGSNGYLSPTRIN
jgi:hypothetical protein